MLILEEVKAMESTQTPNRKFPVRVGVEETKWKFKVLFTDNFDRSEESEWLWKGKLMDKKNRKAIGETLERIEDAIQSALERSINRDLNRSRRERHIERKIERLFD